MGTTSGRDIGHTHKPSVAGASMLHADLDAFYASVAQRDDPSLRGRPVVAGSGVVLAASYEARRFGIHAGMPGRRAARLCPGLVTVPLDFRRYAAASRAVLEVFRRFTPLVEPISPDEAFLDVSGARRLFGTPAEIGERLRREVRAEVGLALSVGVAATKFLAKVASGVAKPDGLLVVPAGGEMEFLHPLPVSRLWGVGPATEKRLEARGIKTVGDLAQLPIEAVHGLVGRGLGSHLHALGWNHDPRAVTPRRPDHSIGSQQALGRCHDLERTERVLLRLADRVGSRLRVGGRTARVVTLRARFADNFATVTRSRTLRRPTSETRVIHRELRRLAERLLEAPAEADLEIAAALEADRQPGADLRVRTVLVVRGVSLLGITLSGLATPEVEQLVLDLDGGRGEASARLEQTVDEIRHRFGRSAVTPAALLAERSAGPRWDDVTDIGGA